MRRSIAKLTAAIIAFALTLSAASCKDSLKPQKFIGSEAYNNRISRYTVVDGISCLDLNFINDKNRFEPLPNVTLPVRSLVDYQIYSTCTDGKYLYMNGNYLGFDENEKIVRKKLIYRVNVNDGDVKTLVSAQLPSSCRNNHSMAVNNGYLYFFLEKENSLNDVCRVSIDGGDVEKLTDNQDEIYTGIFFADNGKVYYHKSDLNLYEAVDGSFESGKIVRENVYTITYEKGIFYCRLENDDFIMFSQDSPENAQTIAIDNMCGSRYLVRDGKIYYMKNLPKSLGFDTENNVESINSTQGKVFVYDIAAGTDELLVENPELDVLSILDINDEVVLVHANTNDAILGYSYGNGEGTYWFMRISDGSIFQIEKASEQ